MNQKSKVQRLEEVYAELPKIECRGLCQDSCGPIMMEKIEWDRICHRVGDRPKAKQEHIDSLSCPLLTTEGQCSVYDIRPMICRLWGVAEEMPCLWGCVPERYLSKQEGHKFLDRVLKIANEGRKLA